MNNTLSKTYTVYRSIINMAHISEVSAPQTVYLLKDFLIEQRIKIRPKHKLVAINYITTDLTNFSSNIITPLALGMVYVKPDNTITQDFYIFKNNTEEFEYLNTDEKLKEKYPKLYGGHKNKFNIRDFA